jgi:hypothetical protein
LERLELISLIKLDEKCNLDSLYGKPGCHVVPKAFSISKNTDEIKSRLISGNACYYSVQNHSSSRLISKNLKIKIYKTVILPLVLYGCETWSLTLKEEHRLRVFENRVLRRIFGPKREEDGPRRKLHNN